MLDIALSLASASADTARRVLDLLDKRGVGDVPIFLNLSADEAYKLADVAAERPSAFDGCQWCRVSRARGGVPQELGCPAELTEATPL